MQEDDVDPDKYRSLAFVGKILPDIQRRYLPPKVSFTCMGDVLKRYAYMLLGKLVHLYTANYWKELDDPWQYLHRRIQKPLLRIREFGAEIHTITAKMQKMYDFLQTFPILGETELNRNKVPKEYTILDRAPEIEPEETIKLNYFGIEPSPELLEKIKSICKDQEEDVKIKIERKKYHDQFHISEGKLYRTGIDGRVRIVVPFILQSDLVDYYHRYYGHIGIEKTLTVLRRWSTWPWMREMVSEFVANCKTCGRAKQDWKRSLGNRKHIEIKDINEYIFVDHFGELPATSFGYKHILVILEGFSKFVKLYPVKSMNTSAIIKRIKEYKEVYAKNEPIQNAISDNGPAF